MCNTVYEETRSLWLWWSIDCNSTCSSLSQHVELQSIDHLNQQIPLPKSNYFCIPSLKLHNRLFFCLFFQIREDWKFVAMVVDRLQLYVFFLVTTVGTIGILMDAPHIFEYVDQDKIIDIYRGK